MTGLPGESPEPPGHGPGGGVDDEPVTLGGSVLPPSRRAGRPRDAAGTPGPAQPSPSPWCAGPPEDPDRYELVGEGVSGGEGVLWRAHYRGRLSAPLVVAVKMLRPPPGAGPGWPTPTDRRRWQDQAALLRHLDIDHMVRLYEVFAGVAPHRPGETGEAPLVAYAVMEWVEGPTLADLVRGVPATRATVLVRLRYVADVAKAVSALHSRTRTGGNPSLHRDVKPTNCIAHPERGVVLLDLSTMRLVDDGFDPVGMLSPGYAAPEVLAAPNLPRRPACDVYSVGALASFCLLGEDPPTDLTTEAERVLLRDRLMDVARDAGAGRADVLADLVLESLETDPARRPRDVLAWMRRVRATAAPRAPDPSGSSPEMPAAAGAGGTADHRDGEAPVPVPVPEPGSGRGSGPGAGRGPADPPADGPGERARNRRGRPRRRAAAALVSAVVALLVLAGGVTAAAVRWGGTGAARDSAPTGTSSARTQALPSLTPTTGASSGSGTGTGVGVSSSATTWQVGEAGAMRGRITSPADGSEVKNCALLSGTSTVPDSATLVLAMRNLDNGDPTRYVEFVYGWDDPALLPRWEGAQFFGSRDYSVGQRYAVELIVVGAELARAARNSGNDTVVNDLADQGVVLHTIRFTRIAGQEPGGCD